jgi:hypothetical protein
LFNLYFKITDALSEDKKKPKAVTLKVKYTHDPNIFDNPVRKNSKADGVFHVISDMEDNFIIKQVKRDMRGQWSLIAKASDKTGKVAFDKESDERILNFIVHERPVANIGLLEKATEYWVTGEESYDIDYQNSLPDNGIVKYQWSFESEDGVKHEVSENEKRVAIPKMYNGKDVEKFSLTVTDFHGATDTTSTTNPINPNLHSNLQSELSKFDIHNPGIPASEEIKVSGIETIPEPTDHVEFALYKNGGRKTQISTLYNPTDVTSSEILLAKWRDVRNYTIPETLPDGDYIGKVRAIKGGKVLENNHKVKVYTPINLEPAMPVQVNCGETHKIIAITSKYANAVTVDVFSDGNITNMVLEKQEGDIKHWKLDYKFPVKPTNKYFAKFKATTPNGNEEIKQVPFNVLDLTVTGYVKHTPDWDLNRKKYNLAKSGNENDPRTYDVFFPGEKFVLSAETVLGVDCDRVDVQILGTSDKTTLTNTKDNLWNGSLWNKAMMNWNDRTLTFRFIAYYSCGVVKTDDVEVKIIKDEYWRLHRKF